MEEKMLKLTEEAEWMKGELRELRDRLEEEEWAKKRVEDRLARCERMEGETKAVVEDLQRERAEWEKEKEALEEKLSKEIEERKAATVRREDGVEAGGGNPRKRYVVIVDSNGRGATSDTIKSHIPKEE